MRDAARLMFKVFAVVFGAGSAVVVLIYLLLGGYYLYGRIRVSNQVEQRSSVLGTASEDITPSLPLYDPKAIPKDAVVPNAELNCRWLNPPPPKGFLLETCAVLVGGRLAAFISRDDAKLSLEGFGPAEPLKKRNP